VDHEDIAVGCLLLYWGLLCSKM